MSTDTGNAGEFITPDGSFIDSLIDLGGTNVKKCFQCGMCSVICPLSPNNRPFPRKEMIWVQLGLKERLLEDPDIWLCHQCSDCSENCPRGSRPGDVMAAIRSYAIMQFAFPGIFAKAFSSPRWLPVLLGISIVLLYGFLAFFGRLDFPDGEIQFHRFISATSLEIAGSIVVGLTMIASVIGLVRFWKRLARFEAGTNNMVENAASRASLRSAVYLAFVDILKHRSFGKCGVDVSRYYSHIAILYGFVLLLLATTGRAAYHFFAGMDQAPPLTDPVKIAGNLGTILLVGGVTVVIFSRLSKRNDAGRATYFDWYFIMVLYLATITGAITQVARLTNLGSAAYWAYLFHLVFVFNLLAYAPYSKFAHLAYRALAMVRARQIGREISVTGESRFEKKLLTCSVLTSIMMTNLINSLNNPF